jgi:hypothetical protein
VESHFFSTLKLELELVDNRKQLIAPQQLQHDLSFWIVGYDNLVRRYSTIGYLSPIVYDRQFDSASKLNPA